MIILLRLFFNVYSHVLLLNGADLFCSVINCDFLLAICLVINIHCRKYVTHVKNIYCVEFGIYFTNFDFYSCVSLHGFRLFAAVITIDSSSSL